MRAIHKNKASGADMRKGNAKEADSPIGFSVNYMDKAFDPRSDFYRYSAGKWLADNPAPPKDKSSWSAFSELYDRNLSLLHGITEECASSANSKPGSVSQMVGDFYASAMDTARIESLKFAPVEELLQKVSGIKSSDDLSRLIPTLHLYGIGAFFNSHADTDQKDSSIYAFYLEQGGLSLPDRDYYLSNQFSKMRDDFRDHVAKMFMLNGMPEPQAKLSADAVLDIETSIAKSSRSRTDLRDPEKNYNRVAVEKLCRDYESLGLEGYMNDTGVPKTSYVIVGQPEFLDSISGMLRSSNIDQLKTYLHWKVLHAYAPFLHNAVDSENFSMFGIKIKGQQVQQPRWKRAIGIVDGCIGEALGKIYVERHFDAAANNEATRMVRDIISAFRERLRKIDWMSEDTRKKALEKLDRLNVKIGHPSSFRDYSGLDIRRDDYVGNIMRSIAFETRREAARVGKPVDRSEWLMTPPTVNAYYSPTENEIVFPAGILQPPFFDPKMDPAVNYGAIGAVIGHEITHGFDDAGRQYDAEGNLHEWWTEKDKSEFKSRSDAVVKLYSAQEVLPGKMLNGELTLGENIADMGGIRIAFDALQMRLSVDPQSDRIVDGLTPEQRFFIAYAQSWREVVTDQEMTRSLTTDPHSPSKYRAVLPAINNPEFDDAFPPGASGEKAEGKDKLGVW